LAFSNEKIEILYSQAFKSVPLETLSKNEFLFKTSAVSNTRINPGGNLFRLSPQEGPREGRGYDLMDMNKPHLTGENNVALIYSKFTNDRS
jgi:hypothetical protein